MCQGTTTHILNGSRVVLEEGDLLFLNQNVEQEILPAGEQDIAVNFIVLPEFFDTAFSMMDMEEENALKEFLVGALCGKSDNTSYLYFHVAEILPIQNLVENMVWTIFYDQPNKRRCNQITMGLLLLQLLNHMDRMETGTAAFDRELTGSVFNYIEEHYKNGSLSELAEIMGYDVYWLSREIKKRTGKTYKELLQSRRMRQAAFLCYVTPAEHLALPNLEDVKQGIMASKIAAHAADIAKGVRGARQADDRMAQARRNLDWEAQWECAMDPETAKRIWNERKPEHEDTCSMCGKFCAVRSMNKALAGEHIDIL